MTAPIAGVKKQFYSLQVALPIFAWIHTIGSGTAKCAIRWMPNGHLERRLLDTYDHPITDQWCAIEPIGQGRPLENIGTLFEVRQNSAGMSGTYTAAAAASDVWIDISSPREWRVEQASVGIKFTASNWDVREIATPSNSKRYSTGNITAQRT